MGMSTVMVSDWFLGEDFICVALQSLQILGVLGGKSRGDLLRKVPLPVGGAKKRTIIWLTIWCILRWYIVTFDKTKQLWAYPMSKTNLHHFLFMSVTLTFWVLRPFWALKSDLASVIALQLQHFVCQTFWYIKIRNPSTNKKVIPQNVKWYRFPKGLLC